MASPNVAKRIRQTRERRGLTQHALAEKAELSAIYIRKLEAGERESPSLDALERIAKVLGVKLVDLLK